MEKFCEYCGQRFATSNPRKLFCSTACRRGADNERKQDRRAEEAERRAEYIMPDVWAEGVGEDVTAGALLDGWTSDCAPASRVPTVGACPQCPHWQMAQRKHKSIALICEMCRDGIKV